MSKSRSFPHDHPLAEEVRVVAPRGAMVAGKYRVSDLMAVGGMGMIFDGVHVDLDQRVAIKFVRPELRHNEEAVARFLNEARSAAKLRGQHVARVLDSGRLDNGIPYLVMEYLDGADLGTVLKRSGSLPVSTAVHYLLQTCEAIAEAHAAGIVHRDLKPENLFLIRAPDGSPVLKVLDFGISKQRWADVKGYTDPTRGIGSPNYMSPEQMVTPEIVDHRSDVWSLGAVLYELIAGRAPFDAPTLAAICVKVLREPPPSLAELRPDLPPALEGVVLRCLNKRREERFSSVAELAQALQPFAPDSARALASRAERILARSVRDSGTTPLPLILPSRSRRANVVDPREASGARRPRRFRSWPFLLAAAAGALVGGAHWLNSNRSVVRRELYPESHERPAAPSAPSSGVPDAGRDAP